MIFDAIASIHAGFMALQGHIFSLVEGHTPCMPHSMPLYKKIAHVHTSTSTDNQPIVFNELAERANVGGTRNVAELGAPLVYYSSDYVFSGEKREPYLESDPTGPLSVYGRTKLEGEQAVGNRAWIVRSSWLFGATGHNFLRTMLKLGAERDEIAVVDDQRGCPTYVAHLAEATRQIVELPFGVYHVAADGDCSWKEFSEAIFEEAGFSCRVRPISSAELNRPAPRPAYSILRSEKTEAPRLPHWREGLRACLEEIERVGP